MADHTQQYYFYVDGHCVPQIAGEMGADAVAAVTTGQRVYWVLHAIMMGLCSSTTALVGRYWGADNKTLAGRFATLSILLFFIDGVIFSWLIIPFREQLLSIFSLSTEAQRLAGEFVFWTLLFAPAMLATLVFNMAFRAIGDSKTPLWTYAIGVPLSILFGAETEDA